MYKSNEAANQHKSKNPNERDVPSKVIPGKTGTDKDRVNPVNPENPANPVNPAHGDNEGIVLPENDRSNQNPSREIDRNNTTER